MVTPGPVLKVTPVESSNSDAWWFLILTTLIFTVIAVLPMLAFFIIMELSAGGGGGPGMVMSGTFLTWGAVLFFGAIGFVAIWGLVAHAILWMTGPTAGGLGRTYQTLCYGAGGQRVFRLALALAAISRGWATFGGRSAQR